MVVAESRKLSHPEKHIRITTAGTVETHLWLVT